MPDFDETLNDILVDTFNNIIKYEEKSLQSIGDIPITVSEAHLLQAVAKNGGQASISELSMILKVTLPTTTVAVKKLEKKGFLEKGTSSEDGRKSVITLTLLGQKAQRAHNLFHRKMVRNVSSVFNEEEKKILISSMSKLSDFFKDKAEN